MLCCQLWVWHPSHLLAQDSDPSVQDHIAEPMAPSSLVEEVVSRIDSPHVFDWRRKSGELGLGIGSIDEANNFETRVYELSYAMPISGGWIGKAAIRRAIVRGTSSSNQIARTPFRQAAQSSRYELAAAGYWSIIEGRSMSRLSPWLSDLEHVFMVGGGVHYSLPNQGWIPKLDEEPEPMPGQETTKISLVLELGLRLHFYLPSGFGLALEAAEHRAMNGDSALTRWNYYTAALLWTWGSGSKGRD
jgi:hypothetical protein